MADDSHYYLEEMGQQLLCRSEVWSSSGWFYSQRGEMASFIWLYVGLLPEKKGKNKLRPPSTF